MAASSRLHRLTPIPRALVYNHLFGYLPTFQIDGVSSSPEKPFRPKAFPKPVRIFRTPYVEPPYSPGSYITRQEVTRTISPLERAFIFQFHIAFAKYPLSHFCRWASYEQVDSEPSIATGSVKSVHLFRSLRGLEHEFVLISFVDAQDQSTSWVRVERAARAKRSRLRPQLDSFGPLMGGVAPLDSISFGISKDDLHSKRDVELASITIETPSVQSNTTGVLTGIYVRELAEQLASIVDDSPEYRLWSTNCRFFARRTMINLTTRFTVHQNTSVTYKWGGLDVKTLADFLVHLQAERFGGSPLVGLGATIANIRTFLHVATVDSNRYNDALDAINNALSLFETLPSHTSRELTALKVDCLEAKARALDNLGLYEESYRICGEAVDELWHALAPTSAAFREYTSLTLRDSYLTQAGKFWFDVEDDNDPFWDTSNWRYCAKVQLMLSIAALRVDHVPEALDAATEASQLIKPRVTHGRGALFLERAIAKTQLFDVLSRTNAVDLPIIIGHEAEVNLRYIHGLRSGARLPLARFLHICANFHSRRGHPKLAFAASSEGIELSRAVPYMFERHGVAFAHALSDHARLAADVGKWDESIASEIEVLGYLRAMNETNPGFHTRRILRSLTRLREQFVVRGDKAVCLGAISRARGVCPGFRC